MKWCRCIAALYLACSAASAATSSHSDHDEHDHSDHDEHGEGGHFEAAALYTVEAGTSSIVAVPSEDMMDGTFAFMLVPAASADEEGLEGAEEDAEAGEWHLLAFCWHSTGQRRRRPARVPDLCANSSCSTVGCGCACANETNDLKTRLPAIRRRATENLEIISKHSPSFQLRCEVFLSDGGFVLGV